MNAKTVLPAVGMTAVSMVLTLAVVVMWLGTAMPWPVAVVVGLGIDGGWLATLAYERRLAAQGDHSTLVTAVGWSFGLIATGVLIAHALNAEESAGESLDQRLAEERPDVGEHDPVDDIVAANPQAFGEDPYIVDEQTLDDAYGDPEAPDASPLDIGRLVEPDEGAHTDTEKDVVARDVGIDGGDESAEEAAIHEIPPPS